MSWPLRAAPPSAGLWNKTDRLSVPNTLGCWSDDTSLVWSSSWACNYSTLLWIFLSFSDSWARGVCFALWGGVQLLQNPHVIKLRGSRDWHRFQFILMGPRLYLWLLACFFLSLLCICLPFLPNCFVNFSSSVRHEDDSLIESTSPVPSCSKPSPCKKSLCSHTHIHSVLSLWLNPN